MQRRRQTPSRGPCRCSATSSGASRSGRWRCLPRALGVAQWRAHPSSTVTTTPCMQAWSTSSAYHLLESAFTSLKQDLPTVSPITESPLAPAEHLTIQVCMTDCYIDTGGCSLMEGRQRDLGWSSRLSAVMQGQGRVSAQGQAGIGAVRGRAHICAWRQQLLEDDESHCSRPEVER